MTIDAVPPHSIEAEQALLGAIIVQQDVFAALDRRQQIVAADFFEPIHQFLFERLKQANDAGQRIDVFLASSLLGEQAAVQLPGGMTTAQYVAALSAGAVTILNAPDYARIIRDHSRRRQIIETANAMLAAAGLDHDPVEAAVAAIENLDEIAVKAAGASTQTTLGEAFDRSIDLMNKGFQSKGVLPGLSTGLRDLDRMIGGLQAHDLVILAARPSMGKTALGVSIARFAAQNGVPTFYFSLEMNETRLADRILSDLVYDRGERIEYTKIPRGEVSEKQAEQLIEASRTYRRLPLRIDSQGALSISQIATRARKHHRSLERQGQALGLVIVDHMHLVAASKRYSGQRVNEITEISGGLKALAKELGVPVLALAQLSRQVESRDNKRPILADLRESGAIEQDADVVMFLYREAYYLRDRLDNPDHEAQRQTRLAEVQNMLEVSISKNRNGPVGTVDLFFDIECNAVRNAARWS